MEGLDLGQLGNISSAQIFAYILFSAIGLGVFIYGKKNKYFRPMIIGAVLIRRKLGVGYIIASFALVFMVLLTLALAAMVLMLVIRQISEDFTVAVVFGVLSVCSMILSYLLFRTLKKSGPV